MGFWRGEGKSSDSMLLSACVHSTDPSSGFHNQKGLADVGEVEWFPWTEMEYASTHTMTLATQYMFDPRTLNKDPFFLLLFTSCTLFEEKNSF